MRCTDASVAHPVIERVGVLQGVGSEEVCRVRPTGSCAQGERGVTGSQRCTSEGENRLDAGTQVQPSQANQPTSALV